MEQRFSSLEVCVYISKREYFWRYIYITKGLFTLKKGSFPPLRGEERLLCKLLHKNSQIPGSPSYRAQLQKTKEQKERGAGALSV